MAQKHKMEERKCDFTIVAFIEGKKQEIHCIPEETGCLRKLVWSGIGVRKAAAKVLGLDETGQIEAYVRGDCDKQINSSFV